MAALPVRVGRTDNTIRPAVMRVDVNQAAAGSAYVELGDTKLLATVYGPRDSSKPSAGFNPVGTLTVDARYAPFARRERILRSSDQVEIETLLSSAVEQAVKPAILLERYPKSSIDIHILVLQSDGSDAAASVTAAALALANAGIDMIDIPSSVRVIGYKSGTGQAHRLLVDPTMEEEAAADFFVDVAVLAQLERMTYYEHAGELPKEALLHASTTAMEACLVTADAMRKVLVNAEKRKARAARKAAVP